MSLQLALALLGAVGPVALLIAFLLDIGGKRTEHSNVLQSLRAQDTVNKELSAQIQQLRDQVLKLEGLIGQEAIRVSTLERMQERTQVWMDRPPRSGRRS